MTSTASPTPDYFVTVQRGDDRPLVFPVTAAGDDVDVTGWPVTATLWRNEYRGADLLHTWSSGDGTAVTEAATVVLLVDDSRAWGFDRGYFEVELTHPDGGVTVQARGVLVMQGHRP